MIACYRLKPGCEAELARIVREHVPTLQKLGLATPRPATALRASDGTVVEIFEWASTKAVERAHTDPVVAGLWERFMAVCDFTTLADLPGAAQPFPHFAPVEL